MKRNMSNTDKMIRMIVAVLIAVLYYTNVISGTLAIIGLVVMAIFVVTSMINFCPLYKVLGITTNKKA